MIIENSSAYFLYKKSKFGNEKNKRNCARLAIHRDFGIMDSYTIESSCYGYEVKGTGNEEEYPDIE